MTQREYEQACEIEKLKKENKELKIKNKDLEAEKKNIQEQIEYTERAIRILTEGK